MTILVFEENEFVKNIINHKKELEGLIVHHCHTLECAKVKMLEEKIDLFIIEDRSGYKDHILMTTIRRQSKYEHTWFILVGDGRRQAMDIVEMNNEFHFYSYLFRDQCQQKLHTVIKELEGIRIHNVLDRTLMIKKKHITHYFDHCDIMMLEVVAKTAYVHMKDASVPIGRVTLTDLESHFTTDEFLRVHRSYIVNKKFIDCVVKDSNCRKIKLKHYDDYIPIGKTYRGVV